MLLVCAFCVNDNIFIYGFFFLISRIGKDEIVRIYKSNGNSSSRIKEEMFLFYSGMMCMVSDPGCNLYNGSEIYWYTAINDTQLDHVTGAWEPVII